MTPRDRLLQLDRLTDAQRTAYREAVLTEFKDFPHDDPLAIFLRVLGLHASYTDKMHERLIAASDALTFDLREILLELGVQREQTIAAQRHVVGDLIARRDALDHHAFGAAADRIESATAGFARAVEQAGPAIATVRETVAVLRQRTRGLYLLAGILIGATLAIAIGWHAWIVPERAEYLDRLMWVRGRLSVERAELERSIPATQSTLRALTRAGIRLETTSESDATIVTIRMPLDALYTTDDRRNDRLVVITAER